MDKNTDISKTFAERIEQRVVDLATGEYVKDAPKEFSAHRRQRPCPKHPNQTEDDLAGIKSRAKYTEVYLVKAMTAKSAKSSCLCTVTACGLLCTALSPSNPTATPSTASPTTTKAKPRAWAAKSAIRCGNKIRRQKLFDEQGKLALHVGKGASSDKEHGVDALSGASLTSKGVQGSFAYWFGETAISPT